MQKLNILRISSTFVPPWRGLGPGPFELTNAQHEIGHSVGFRHTDWFNRASCGQNVNEGAGSIGAIDLGGNSPETSVMLACFSSNEDGEFGVDDINGLQIMY